MAFVSADTFPEKNISFYEHRKKYRDKDVEIHDIEAATAVISITQKRVHKLDSVVEGTSIFPLQSICADKLLL